MNRRGLWKLALPTAVFLLVSTACSNAERPLDWLQPEGPITRDIGNLWTFVFWVAVAVFFLVEGAIVFAIFRFRERKDDTSPPKQTHGNTPLEIGWTIAPAIILAALAFPTLAGIWSLAEEKPNSMHVDVTGHQWWWQYNYEGEKFAIANELHIPTGQPVRLALGSADVIHSYWVPKLAGKQDVVPARTNYITMIADRPGTYAGTCAEFCGLSHANMRAKVIAHSPADFKKWMAGQREEAEEPTSALAKKGKLVFLSSQCVTCHTIRGAVATIDGKEVAANGTTAPDLTHFAQRTSFAGAIFERNDRNLTRWISNAPAEKPGSLMPAGLTEMGLTPEDVEALVAYLQSLG